MKTGAMVSLRRRTPVGVRGDERSLPVRDENVLRTWDPRGAHGRRGRHDDDDAPRSGKRPNSIRGRKLGLRQEILKARHPNVPLKLQRSDIDPEPTVVEPAVHP